MGIQINGGGSTDIITFDYDEINNVNGLQSIGVYIHFKVNAAFNASGATRICSQWGSGNAAVWLMQSLTTNALGFLVGHANGGRRGAQSSFSYVNGTTYKLFWTYAIEASTSHEHTCQRNGVNDTNMSNWADNGPEGDKIRDVVGSETDTFIGYETSSSTGANDITVFEFARYGSTSNDKVICGGLENRLAVTAGAMHPTQLPDLLQYTSFYDTSEALDLVSGATGTVGAGCADEEPNNSGTFTHLYGPPHTNNILQFPPTAAAPATSAALLSHPHRHTNLGFG